MWLEVKRLAAKRQSIMMTKNINVGKLCLNTRIYCFKVLHKVSLTDLFYMTPRSDQQAYPLIFFEFI